MVLCFRQFVRVALYFSLVFGKCFFGRFDLFLQGFGFLAVLACCLGRFVICGFGLIELVLQLGVLLPQFFIFSCQFGYPLAVGGDLLLLGFDLLCEHLYPGANLLVRLTHQLSFLGG